MDRRLSRSHTRYRPRKVIKGGTMFRLGRMTRRVALLAFVTVLAAAAILVGSGTPFRVRRYRHARPVAPPTQGAAHVRRRADECLDRQRADRLRPHGCGGGRKPARFDRGGPGVQPGRALVAPPRSPSPDGHLLSSARRLDRPGDARLGLLFAGLRSGSRPLAAASGTAVRRRDSRLDGPGNARLGRRLLRRCDCPRRGVRSRHRDVADDRGLAARSEQQPLGVWTGRELVLFVSGISAVDGKPLPPELARAAAYDPATDTWRPIAPLPESRVGATAVWSGREILVVGGRDGNGALAGAGLAHNPTTTDWRRFRDGAGAHPEQSRPGREAACWSGAATLVARRSHRCAAGSRSTRQATAGRRFRSPLEARTDAIAAWTGRELIVWGGVGAGDRGNGRRLDDGAAFAPRPVTRNP